MKVKTQVLLGVMMIMMLGILWGCKEEKKDININSSTTCANVVMGMGRFEYRNNFMYFADVASIYEYDMESGKTVVFPVEFPGDPQDLFVTDDYILYCGYTKDFKSGTLSMSRDGKNTETVFVGSEGCYQLYIDGKDAYYLSGRGGNLYHQNLVEKKETMLLDRVLSYYWTEDVIYAIKDNGGTYSLMKQAKGETDFQEIPLSFSPIEILVVDEELYLSQMGTYQLVHYRDGVETPLPINSVKYQALDGCVVFSDESSFKNSTWTVKSYDLKTGEVKELCQSAMEFGIFENRYIIFWCRGNEGSWWKLYDWNTKEIKQIYPTEK